MAGITARLRKRHAVVESKEVAYSKLVRAIGPLVFFSPGYPREIAVGIKRKILKFVSEQFRWTVSARALVAAKLISQKVFVKSFCERQFSQKSVSLFFILVIIKNTLTDFCRNGLAPNDFINTLCETKPVAAKWSGRI